MWCSPLRLTRGRRAAACGSLVAVALVAAGTVLVAPGPDASASQTTSVPQSVAAPAGSSASPTCSTPGSSASGSEGPESTLAPNPITTIVKPANGVDTFTVTSTGIYVLDADGMSVYNLEGALQTSFSLPSSLTSYSTNGVAEPVVAPDGTIYLSSYYGQTVDAFSPSGTLLWSEDPDNGNPDNIFAVTSSSGQFELAVSNLNATTSDVLTEAGAVVGTTTLVAAEASTLSQESGGDILYSNMGVVQTWSPDGQTMLSEFGSPNGRGVTQHTGGAFQFEYPGQAAQGPDGTIYNADPLDTLTATAPNGLLEGSTTFNSSIAMEPTGGLFVVGSNLYFSSGPAFQSGSSIVEVPISTFQQYMDAPHTPVDALGWGAGLATTASGNYFAPGTTPTVDAQFASWWTTLAPQMQLTYSVWNNDSMTAEKVPTPRKLDLPTTSSALASVPLTISAVDQSPGPYEVSAELWNTATSPATMVGETCLPYTVGASGDRLDLSSLPSGSGGGGPSDPRGVALNSQLGLDGLRSGETLDWSNFLPDCQAGSPTAATCGPSAMSFGNAPQSYFQAAYLAAQDHVHYWVQVSGGDATSGALVSGGWWQADIQKLVAYYATPPSSCSNCAAVTAWEPWNESNNTGWSNGGTYVTQVLEPFYEGVKAADPSATVIGGSTLGLPLDWWQQLISAGGLHYMDVAGAHPYPGNNDSWQEDGITGQIKDLEQMLGSTPLWFTELGWWSDGDYNYLHQADAVSQAMVLMKTLDVPVLNYFFDEGNWGNDGVSFSLIQTDDQGDDYVKPAALATMVASNQTSDRSFESMPATGIPQTSEALFGPTSQGTTDMAALWSDELDTDASVSISSSTGSPVPVTVTSEYGDTTTVSMTPGTSYSLPVTSQLQYLSFPQGDSLQVSAPEAYGSDLALASGGATASASSGNAGAAITGLDNTTSEGQGWSSQPGDTSPSLTVSLPTATTVNRVIVDTQGAGSDAPGLRDYTVSGESPDGTWSTVGAVTDELRAHEAMVVFSPQRLEAVRINVTMINFGGYYGGGVPWFWPVSSVATAFVHEIEVYGGTDGVDAAQGRSLPGLVPADGSGGGTPPTTTPPTTTPPTTTPTTTTPTTTQPTTTPPTTTPPTTAPPTTTPTTTPPTTTPPTTTPPTTAPPTTTPPTKPAGTDVAATVATPGGGELLAAADGKVQDVLPAHYYGELNGLPAADPLVGIAATPDGRGYWLTTRSGQIHGFGDARFYGSASDRNLGHPVVAIASSPSGHGYWLTTSIGQVVGFGDAKWHGSTARIDLGHPVVGIAPAAGGNGYWLTTTTGQVYGFGDAPFFGSTSSSPPASAVEAVAATTDGHGYWLTTTSGQIFNFGDAHFYGAVSSGPLARNFVSIARTTTGKGYWLTTASARRYGFGDAITKS